MKKNKDNIDLQDDRYGLFMTENSYNLDVMYGRLFLKTDNAQKITLHRINIIESKSHVLYGQTKAKDKKFLTPITLSAMVTIQGSELNYYAGDNSGLSRDDTGKIEVGIYLDELREKNVDINRGDIIGYNQSGEKNRYYEVENANDVTDTTDKTIGGFKPYWRKVIGVPVKSDVIPFLNENTKGS